MRGSTIEPIESLREDRLREEKNADEERHPTEDSLRAEGDRSDE